jgi:hypothetical protein
MQRHAAAPAAVHWAARPGRGSAQGAIAALLIHWHQMGWRMSAHRRGGVPPCRPASGDATGLARCPRTGWHQTG